MAATASSRLGGRPDARIRQQVEAPPGPRAGLGHGIVEAHHRPGGRGVGDEAHAAQDGGVEHLALHRLGQLGEEIAGERQAAGALLHQGEIGPGLARPELGRRRRQRRGGGVRQGGPMEGDDAERPAADRHGGARHQRPLPGRRLAGIEIVPGHQHGLAEGLAPEDVVPVLLPEGHALRPGSPARCRGRGRAAPGSSARR